MKKSLVIVSVFSFFTFSAEVQSSDSPGSDLLNARGKTSDSSAIPDTHQESDSEDCSSDTPLFSTSRPLCYLRNNDPFHIWEDLDRTHISQAEIIQMTRNVLRIKDDFFGEAYNDFMPIPEPLQPGDRQRPEKLIELRNHFYNYFSRNLHVNKINCDKNGFPKHNLIKRAAYTQSLFDLPEHMLIRNSHYASDNILLNPIDYNQRLAQTKDALMSEIVNNLLKIKNHLTSTDLIIALLPLFNQNIKGKPLIFYYPAEYAYDILKLFRLNLLHNYVRKIPFNYATTIARIFKTFALLNFPEETTAATPKSTDSSSSFSPSFSSHSLVSRSQETSPSTFLLKRPSHQNFSKRFTEKKEKKANKDTDVETLSISSDFSEGRLCVFDGVPGEAVLAYNKKRSDQKERDEIIAASAEIMPINRSNKPIESQEQFRKDVLFSLYPFFLEFSPFFGQNKAFLKALEKENIDFRYFGKSSVQYDPWIAAKSIFLELKNLIKRSQLTEEKVKSSSALSPSESNFIIKIEELIAKLYQCDSEEEFPLFLCLDESDLNQLVSWFNLFCKTGETEEQNEDISEDESDEEESEEIPFTPFVSISESNEAFLRKVKPHIDNHGMISFVTAPSIDPWYCAVSEYLLSTSEIFLPQKPLSPTFNFSELLDLSLPKKPSKKTTNYPSPIATSTSLMGILIKDPHNKKRYEEEFITQPQSITFVSPPLFPPAEARIEDYNPAPFSYSSVIPSLRPPFELFPSRTSQKLSDSIPPIVDLSIFSSDERKINIQNNQLEEIFRKMRVPEIFRQNVSLKPFRANLISYLETEKDILRRYLKLRAFFDSEGLANPIVMTSPHPNSSLITYLLLEQVTILARTNQISDPEIIEDSIKVFINSQFDISFGNPIWHTIDPDIFLAECINVMRLLALENTPVENIHIFPSRITSFSYDITAAAEQFSENLSEDNTRSEFPPHFADILPITARSVQLIREPFFQLLKEALEKSYAERMMTAQNIFYNLNFNSLSQLYVAVLFHLKEYSKIISIVEQSLLDIQAIPYMIMNDINASLLFPSFSTAVLYNMSLFYERPSSKKMALDNLRYLFNHAADNLHVTDFFSNFATSDMPNEIARILTIAYSTLSDKEITDDKVIRGISKHQIKKILRDEEDFSRKRGAFDDGDSVTDDDTISCSEVCGGIYMSSEDKMPKRENSASESEFCDDVRSVYVYCDDNTRADEGIDGNTKRAKNILDDTTSFDDDLESVYQLDPSSLDQEERSKEEINKIADTERIEDIKQIDKKESGVAEEKKEDNKYDYGDKVSTISPKIAHDTDTEDSQEDDDSKSFASMSSFSSMSSEENDDDKTYFRCLSEYFTFLSEYRRRPN